MSESIISYLKRKEIIWTEVGKSSIVRASRLVAAKVAEATTTATGAVAITAFPQAAPTTTSEAEVTVAAEATITTEAVLADRAAFRVKSPSQAPNLANKQDSSQITSK